MNKFLFGSSTASHQVEGNTNNDWSKWELENANKLAQKAQSAYFKTSEIKQQATNSLNYISGEASGHYDRFEQDFDILKSLGQNAFRFSIEWSRVMPTENSFNQDEINHYHQVLDALIARNIEPVVTLWHFTSPTWFIAVGGFSKKANLKHFETYVAKIVEEYGSKINIWITINEPNIYAGLSYLTGDWPPSNKNILKYFACINNFIKAHKLAYKLIKGKYTNAKISIAHNAFYIKPFRKNNILDNIATFILKKWNNYFVLDRIKKQMDYIGLNFYFRNVMHAWAVKNPNEKTSDLAWDLYPQGIEFVITELYKRYNLPILITENGIADVKDEQRAWFIEESLTAIKRSMSSGSNVMGYLHWSLLDNFEWAQGKWPRFGLVEVDYKTQERKVRASALKYKELIEKF